MRGARWAVWESGKGERERRERGRKTREKERVELRRGVGADEQTTRRNGGDPRPRSPPHSSRLVSHSLSVYPYLLFDFRPNPPPARLTLHDDEVYWLMVLKPIRTGGEGNMSNNILTTTSPTPTQHYYLQKRTTPSLLAKEGCGMAIFVKIFNKIKLLHNV